MCISRLKEFKNVPAQLIFKLSKIRHIHDILEYHVKENILNN